MRLSTSFKQTGSVKQEGDYSSTAKVQTNELSESELLGETKKRNHSFLDISHVADQTRDIFENDLEESSCKRQKSLSNFERLIEILKPSHISEEIGLNHVIRISRQEFFDRVRQKVAEEPSRQNEFTEVNNNLAHCILGLFEHEILSSGECDLLHDQQRSYSTQS